MEQFLTFAVLAIHKNTMKAHINKLQSEKMSLSLQLEEIVKEIVELQKETEQFAYILNEQKQEDLKKFLLTEEEASNEYIQSKYIHG